jgi:hypothetical protein
MTRTLIALLLALAVPFTASARDDERRDRHEVRKDRGALRDDLRDVQLAQGLLQEFERAWGALDRVALRNVEQRVLKALDDELREKTWESRSAARELHRDRRELRDDRHDGDRKELADDRQDLMRTADYGRRVEALRKEFGSMRFVTNWQAMSRKHALIEELVKLARTEIREDMEEMRDDRRP